MLCQYDPVPEERAFGLAAALCSRDGGIDAGETLVLSSLPAHLIPGSAGAEEGEPPLFRGPGLGAEGAGESGGGSLQQQLFPFFSFFSENKTRRSASGRGRAGLPGRRRQPRRGDEEARGAPDQSGRSRGGPSGGRAGHPRQRGRGCRLGLIECGF